MSYRIHYNPDPGGDGMLYLAALMIPLLSRAHYHFLGLQGLKEVRFLKRTNFRWWLTPLPRFPRSQG